MKHVNFDPELEKKKDSIMEQFRDGNGPLEAPQPNAEAIAEITAQSDGAPSVEELREHVIEALKTVYDPEIPVNIYDLGLIYRVDISEGFAEVDMTLTAPGCPVAQTFPGMVEATVKLVPGISDAVVDLVWDPPWTSDLISEAARLELGLI